MAKKDEQLNLRLRSLELAAGIFDFFNTNAESKKVVEIATAFFDFLNVDIVKEKQDDRKALADATVEKYAEVKKGKKTDTENASVEEAKPAAKKPALVANEKTMAAKSEMKEPVENEKPTEAEASEIDYDKQVRPATLTFASANGRAALTEIFTVFGIKKNASELKPAQYANYLEALKNYGGEEEAVA